MGLYGNILKEKIRRMLHTATEGQLFNSRLECLEWERKTIWSIFRSFVRLYIFILAKYLQVCLRFSVQPRVTLVSMGWVYSDVYWDSNGQCIVGVRSYV